MRRRAGVTFYECAWSRSRPLASHGDGTNTYAQLLPLLGALQKHSLQQELESLQRRAKPQNWTHDSDRIRDVLQLVQP